VLVPAVAVGAAGTPVKVGDESGAFADKSLVRLVILFWEIVDGKLRVTAPAEAETVTSSAVPAKLVTPVLVIVKAAVSDPEPETSIPDPAAAVAT
jgi:hypothetical protein